MNSILYLFALLSLTDTVPKLEISVAQGKKSVIPRDFETLSALNQLKIKQSYWAEVKISRMNKGDYILQGGKLNLNEVHFYSKSGEFLFIGNHIRISLDKSDTTFFLYYPFVDEKDPNLLSITLEREIAFIQKSANEVINQYAFHSFLLFPLLVSLILFIRTWSWVYLFYSLYIFSVMYFFGYQYGILGKLIPAINSIPPIWIWLSGSIQAITYVLFSITFLDLKRVDLLSFKMLIFGVGFSLFFTAVSISLYVLNIDVQHSFAFKAPFWSIQIILIIWFTVRTFNHPSKIKYYYLGGFLVLSAVVISGQILSATRSAPDYNYLFQMGLVLEIFILGLGLSVRVNEVQKEKDLAQVKLIEQLKVNERLQREYTQELEIQVKKRTESLNLRNQENEVLLKEVHHRVKNNLQMIMSMINMYNRRSDSEEVEGVLLATRNKIKSMALIHEHLYAHEDFSNVMLDEYLTRLIKMIISSLYKGKEISLDLSISCLRSDIQTSISLGLILNELITNSIKYALNDHPNPLLIVTLYEDKKKLYLEVQDNGRRISEPKKDGLGYTIIQSILDNMSGNINRMSTPNGFNVKIHIQDYYLIKD